MGNATSDWEEELKRWLKPFLDRLGHKARRRMCPLYVGGLIGPGERKSIQPMAERFAAGDYWRGLHRHTLMTMIAYAFLQHRRLTQVGWKKRITGLRLNQHARRTPRDRRSHSSTAISKVPILQETNP